MVFFGDSPANLIYKFLIIISLYKDFRHGSSCELHTTTIGSTNHGVIFIKIKDVALNKVGQIAIL